MNPCQLQLLTHNTGNGDGNGDGMYAPLLAPWIDVHRRVCASRRDCTKAASAHHEGAGEGAGFGSTVVVLSCKQNPSWRARPLAMRPCWNDLGTVQSR